MSYDTLFKNLCNARLHGRPGELCHKPALPGRKRCKFHGGIPRGPQLNPRRVDAKKPGPKPRDPMIVKRRKLHARLLRTDPDLAPAVPPFSTPAGRGSRAAARAASRKDAPAPNVRPPWPRHGYAGGPNARALEKNERQFIRELNVAPFDASRYERLTPARAAEILDRFGEREAHFRRDGDEARRMRIERLRWEIDEYFKRLAVRDAIAAAKAAQVERQASEQAALDFQAATARTEAMIGHHVAAAEARAANLPPRQSGPRSIAPWIRR